MSGRQFIWARAGGTFILTAGSTETNEAYNEDLLEEFENEYGADIVGSTVTRIRGVIAVYPEQGATNPAMPIFGIRRYGERVSPNNLDNLASEPGPFSGPHADWMMYLPVFMSIEIPYQSREIVVDVKANRKIEELGQSLMLSAEQDPAIGTEAYNVVFALSIGLKLP